MVCQATRVSTHLGSIGKGGEAFDVGEEDRHVLPLAAQLDALDGPLDGLECAAGDELLQVEALEDRAIGARVAEGDVVESDREGLFVG